MSKELWSVHRHEQGSLAVICYPENRALAIVAMVEEAERLQKDGWEVVSLTMSECRLSHRFRPGIIVRVQRQC